MAYKVTIFVTDLRSLEGQVTIQFREADGEGFELRLGEE